jgi:hypothetical protein
MCAYDTFISIGRVSVYPSADFPEDKEFVCRYIVAGKPGTVSPKAN